VWLVDSSITLLYRDFAARVGYGYGVFCCSALQLGKVSRHCLFRFWMFTPGCWRFSGFAGGGSLGYRVGMLRAFGKIGSGNHGFALLSPTKFYHEPSAQRRTYTRLPFLLIFRNCHSLGRVRVGRAQGIGLCRSTPVSGSTPFPQAAVRARCPCRGRPRAW
jgi:hypothetical protein